MTARNQPHKYRCETCSFNKETADCGCPAWQFNKFLVPIIGCASHSSATKAEQRIADTILRWRKIKRPKYKRKGWGFGGTIEMGYIGDIPVVEMSSWHQMEDHKDNPYNIHVFLPFRDYDNSYCDVRDEGQYREALTKDEAKIKAQKIVNTWFALLREKGERELCEQNVIIVGLTK